LGGFEITKKCEDITFLEIYEAIDGKLTQVAVYLARICVNAKPVLWAIS
jgi:DNA-binding IscR family transcriptional regulator